ncbi:hypothetical protein EGQ50_01155 [Coxiella endosymbiont of Amblyomma sculptum]|nr:hypothetical protein EGQ50_01155 [Coxiella endosymbiont of Amblyomma sculptum]
MVADCRLSGYLSDCFRENILTRKCNCLPLQNISVIKMNIVVLFCKPRIAKIKNFSVSIYNKSTQLIVTEITNFL